MDPGWARCRNRARSVLVVGKRRPATDGRARGAGQTVAQDLYGGSGGISPLQVLLSFSPPLVRARAGQDQAGRSRRARHTGAQRRGACDRLETLELRCRVTSRGERWSRDGRGRPPRRRVDPLVEELPLGSVTRNHRAPQVRVGSATDPAVGLVRRRSRGDLLDQCGPSARVVALPAEQSMLVAGALLAPRPAWGRGGLVTVAGRPPRAGVGPAPPRPRSVEHVLVGR